jgi:hypothetical protein
MQVAGKIIEMVKKSSKPRFMTGGKQIRIGQYWDR